MIENCFDRLTSPAISFALLSALGVRKPFHAKKRKEAQRKQNRRQLKSVKTTNNYQFSIYRYPFFLFHYSFFAMHITVASMVAIGLVSGPVTAKTSARATVSVFPGRRIRPSATK